MEVYPLNTNSEREYEKEYTKEGRKAPKQLVRFMAEKNRQERGSIYIQEAGENTNTHKYTHRPSLPFIILCCFCFVVVHFASSHCSLSLFSGRQYSPNEKKLGRPEKLRTTTTELTD